MHLGRHTWPEDSALIQTKALPLVEWLINSRLQNESLQLT